MLGGFVSALGQQRLAFNGAFSTSSASTPVTSATRTINLAGTLRFSDLAGIVTLVEYSKNAGAWTTITEGGTLAKAASDTLAVRSAIAIAPNSTTFNIKNDGNGALIEAVTLERT